jgi:capsular exopolysaccharide synthesis family protein
VEILCDSPDPQLAADFANTLANEFIEQNVEVRWNATKRTGEWLGRQLGDVKQKLESSEERLQAYARASHLVWTSEKDSVAEGKLRQLQEELSRANGDRVAKQSQYEIAATSPPDSLPAVLDNSVLRDLQIKLADLRRELAQLRPSYKPAHYKVQQVQAQIEEVEGALRKERASLVNRIRNEYQAALRRERLLLSAYEAQTKLVSEQAEKAIQYHILKREVETNRQLYEAMLQRLKEAGIASAMRASNIRIVDTASPPATPYKPNPLQNAALGVMAGLALGVGLVLMREHSNRMRASADHSIKVPGDSPAFLQVPELGVIPCGSAGSVRVSRLGSGLALFRGRHGDDSDAPHGVELATWDKPASVVAESFRATLASVLFSGRSGNGTRLLVVTSPSPGEGKSTVASNLAIALAEIRPRVLLIDGDLRRSRLHRLYGVDNSRGLSDLLRAAGAPRDMSSRVLIRETKVPHLYLLPSGSGGAAVSRLFHSARARELLQGLGREFDAVVIDAPPLMHIADARLLGRLADGVILVFRSGVTTREVALAARQCFIEDGTPVLGTILNDWDPEAAGPPYAGAYYDYRYFDPQLRTPGRQQL